jgi:hypothetical protein
MRMGRSTFVLIAAVRRTARLASLVSKIVCAAIGDLAIGVVTVGRMAFSHDAFYAGGVVQIGVKLPAFDVACGLLDIASRSGTLLFKVLIALVRQPLLRSRLRLALLRLAEHFVDVFSVSTCVWRTRRRSPCRSFAALMRAT